MEAATDYTMWALFARATLIVKLVMIMLIVASIWCWAIIIDKMRQYRKAKQQAAEFEDKFWSGNPLDDLYENVKANPTGANERIFAAGMAEWNRSFKAEGGFAANAQSRIDRAMDLAISKESDSLQKGLTVLATVGSATPFVGLFGTVWGIMNAFIEIAEAQTTNLAVVAPGIAEALLATGLGLLAAIPAVIFYNKFSNDSDRIMSGYDAFADEFSTILGRQLDR